MIQLSCPLCLLVALPIAVVLVALAVRQRQRLVLRAVTLLLLVLALAGPRVSRLRQEQNVLLLIDRSASVTRTSDDAATHEAIHDLISTNPDVSFGLLEFARSGSLTAPFGVPPAPLGTASLDDTATNLDRAVTHALSLLPNGAANQLVLLSDGRFADDMDIAAGAARIAGVPISVLPVGTSPEADAALVSLDGPSEVTVGRPFALDLAIRTPTDADATLVVYRDDDLIRFEQLSLSAGTTRFSIEDRFSEATSHTYEAIVKADDDPIPGNDALSVLVIARDRPSVAVIDPAGESAVADLLTSLDLEFTSLLDVPTIEILSTYRQLILTGQSFATLTDDEVDALDAFVRDLGGGLLVVEGEEEVRGIRSGGIEEILPVSYTMPEPSREAQMALVYVLDRSSSMRSRVGGVTKIEILKEAAAASAALLDATTHVGILAFNLEQDWIVPIEPVDSSSLYHALRTLEAIGGTDIYYPIVEALDRLEEIDVPSKHILLISDGKTVDEPRNYAGLIRRLQELDDVTLSAIGVGRTMNVSLLSALVEAGQGTLYRADDFSLLPQVSIQATQRISRKRFIDGPAQVAGRLAEGSDIEAIPPLDGYVLTYPKPAADTSLWSGDDPIVSSWRLGLGAVTVLNTDLTGRGSEAWLSWPELSTLFEAILATAQPDRPSALGLSARLVQGTETTELLVDAYDGDDFADFLDLDVALLPDGAVQELAQVGPGLYAATLSTPPEGGYALRITDRSRGRTLTVPFTVPYSGELRTLGPDLAVLDRIAQITGGRRLVGDMSLPGVSGGTSTEHQSLHVPLLLAALGLFLLDLLVRKWPQRATKRR